MLSTKRRSSLHTPGLCRPGEHRRPLSPAGWLAVAALPILAAAWAGVAYGDTLTVQATVAGSCTAGSGTLNFGEYESGQPDPLDSSATFSVTCPDGQPVTIKLSQGGGLNGGARGMTRSSGDGMLTYNLYTTDQHDVIWGDGTFEQPVVIGFFESGQATQVVYGRVPGGQIVDPDLYEDTVTITVDLGSQ